MSRKRGRMIGWSLLILAFVQFVVLAVLCRSTGIDWLGDMAYVLFPIIVSLSYSTLSRFKTEEKVRQMKIEEKDERSIMIRGKAAYFALTVGAVIFVILMLYLFVVRKEGILSICLTLSPFFIVGVAFLVGLAYYERKM